MRRFTITKSFVIGDLEDPIRVADKWLKETVENYSKSPSSGFDIEEHQTVRRANQES
jgi:hypothetical protein